MTKLKFSVCAVASALSVLPASALNISQVPLNLSVGVPPNVMVLYDNSQSMDGTMAGKIVTGSPEWAASVATGGTLLTRGDIARSVLQQVVSRYRTQFNWGLMTFNVTDSSAPYTTYAYYFGTDAGMTMTNDCVGGISASQGGRRCFANPNGTGFVTYDKSGDDPDVNDVLYTPADYGPSFWGRSSGAGTVASPNTTYNIAIPYNTATNPTWTLPGSFSGMSFTPTDAGFLPANPPYVRQVWVKRGWGYNSNISGAGKVLEPIQADSTTHFTNLSAFLKLETANTATTEIKNRAIFTPLTGSLKTAQNYFGGSGYTSPIQTALTCQKNFVLLATDGNPTGKTNGSQYAPADWASPGTSGASFADASLAYKDVYNQISALRSTSYNSSTYDVKTYVIGLGDSVQNATSVTGLNAMAGFGGTGNAYLATDQAGLMTAFESIVSDIATASAAGVGVTASSGELKADTLTFQVGYNSADWSGTFVAKKINADGSVGTNAWDAAALLKTRTPSTRNIVTYKPSAAIGARGINFAWPVNPITPTATEMDPAQIALLNQNFGGAADGFGVQRMAYIRGDSSNEASVCPTCAPKFRNRPSGPLGDIINSAATYIAAPAFNYPDNMESAAYSHYVNANKNRTPLVLVGANDGMLHAFQASDGTEKFAYLPAAVYPNLSNLADPAYTHRFLVDGTTTIGDVFYDSSWHTLAIGAFRGGVKGLYAIEPYATASSSIPRWEFTDADDPDMGNVWGQPLVVKTNDGKWSVIVSNGYNSSSGQAALFILDAKTGALKKKITVSSGTNTATAINGQNGLSGAVAVDTNGDGIADTVYAGDLGGSLWKFDLTDATASNWKVAFSGSPLFTVPAGSYVPQVATGALTGPAAQPSLTGVPRAITERPVVARSKTGGYLVTFGTGRYIQTSDVADTGLNMQFGIRDNNSGPVAVSDLVEQRFVSGTFGSALRTSSFAVGSPSAFIANPSTDNVIQPSVYQSTKKGWMFMLSTDPSTTTNGERVVFEAVIRSGRVIISSMKPDAGSNACLSGKVTSYLTELDVETGNRLNTSVVFDTNNDSVLGAGDNPGNSIMINGLIGVPAILTPGESGCKAGECIYTPNGKIEAVGGYLTAKRVSWLQIK